ncbi:DUF4973 domain-containing protein [Bacteroides xylanisolvens]|jgi:hypothetical protein|uniref:DUF4973 domain-containing protein n=1 Tax=Bacteroides xylanisolvens TaxID=371601 RepID=A0A3E4N2V9_9BACE|nr:MULTISPECIES: DUF4973 domain-containing protein [Bacteroides]MCA4533395.1 DUF4973 domain-containing protein [Bacteroides xylanisolvens]MCA4552205.1 DUF4973 domain-containing protein [Bacteroides xylanisolvens]MCA4565256.1 DUF4973 domain-containing protein [Bacteroides xylanisolvens]MCA4570009.1 DUF4973 domain-containing protein [Bacteroides xylanisolvens]MCA4602731.1 DUF4973 domain-containing protein [Bacteroides xylanisolvens]
MRKLYVYLIILVATALCSSCNNEWEDEQYESYISFKAPVNADTGVTDVYVRYKEDGKVTYRLPVIVSGSNTNQKDMDIHVAVDLDTLNTLNRERFSTREELWYEALEENKFEFPEVIHIPAGSNVALLDVDFKLNNLNMVNKWVLPLTIVDNASYNYQSHPRKNYAKALLKIIPFNDYSGSYSTTTMEVYIKNQDGSFDKKPLTTNTRTAYVVDDNTIFFYAGLMGEELEQRETYKICMHFDEENMTVDITAPHKEEIYFKNNVIPNYSVAEIMDSTRPYLMHRYVSFTIDYDFADVTSAPEPIYYKVQGTMMLERNFNKQIPDEDQQIEW